MPLTPQDRELVRRCLHREMGAWNQFVEQYLGLIFHVINHTAHLRSYPIKPDEAEDIAAAIMLQIVDNDFAVLRQFRGKSSLSSYLTVIARRTCVHELARRAGIKEVPTSADPENVHPKSTPAVETREAMSNSLKRLPERDRQVVRMYYLEGLTYEEISQELDVPVNSIGSILTRARRKLKGDDNGDTTP